VRSCGLLLILVASVLTCFGQTTVRPDVDAARPAFVSQTIALRPEQLSPRKIVSAALKHTCKYGQIRASLEKQGSSKLIYFLRGQCSLHANTSQASPLADSKLGDEEAQGHCDQD
jgi:hypothetical protein